MSFFDVEIIEFLEKEKERYLLWIKTNCKDYPYCCAQSSEVIGAYISERFGKGRLTHGIVEVEDYYDENGEICYPFHAWVRISEGVIVDFTAFQFWDREEDWSLDLDAEVYFERIIRETQKSCIIMPDNPLWENYFSTDSYDCRFSHLVKQNSFEDYLIDVLQSPEFINYEFIA